MHTPRRKRNLVGLFVPISICLLLRINIYHIPL